MRPIRMTDFAGQFERLCDRIRLGLTDDRDHSDAAIERPRHFLRSDLPARLKLRENRRQVPRIRVYDCMAAFG